MAAEPPAGVPICHVATDSDSEQPAQHKPIHAGHDCVLCVLCLAQASAASVDTHKTEGSYQFTVSR